MPPDNTLVKAARTRQTPTCASTCSLARHMKYVLMPVSQGQGSRQGLWGVSETLPQQTRHQDHLSGK